MPTRQEIVTWIKKAYDVDHGKVDTDIENWRKQFVPNPLFGYYVTKFPLQVATVAGFLYEQTGDRSLADFACRTMLRYREFVNAMPPDAVAKRPEYAEGVPPLDCAFDPVQFCPTVERIRPALSAADDAALAEVMADSLRFIWLFPEWGGHNRAMLRAASLAMAAHTWPKHAQAANWVSMADELAEESWGRWSIEDATLYQTHWLRSLILYSEARGKGEFNQFVQPRLHLRAISQIISPLGILPDIGDSHWLMHNAWEWMACLEWGARTYRDQTMKWAAQQIWTAQQREQPNIYAAMVLSTAWRWCDDTVAAEPPGPTLDAADDMISKKVIFRNNWDSDAAYACLTYKDEGDYARVARDYLRTNLAVSAEKMHHGHADEGSIAMLVHKQTILLHESGYREDPPDGMYRADLYHNRVIWRPGACLPESDTFEYLRDNGHYKATRTERLYQTKLLDAQLSRVRVTDEKRGVQWDRSICFVPSWPAWVVIDSVQALQTAPRTLAALWWTTDILARGDDWFDTHIAGIGAWKNERRAALLVMLPEIEGQRRKLGVYPFRRCFQQEQAMVSTWTGEHRAGRFVNFVTVLVPHDMAAAAHKGMSASVAATEPAGKGLAVRVTLGAEERLFCTLNDLTSGYLQEDIRPRYTFAQGRTAYGPVVSDAAMVYVRTAGGRQDAGFINGTRLEMGGKLLFQQPTHDMFQENRTSLPGVAARFRWETGTK